MWLDRLQRFSGPCLLRRNRRRPGNTGPYCVHVDQHPRDDQSTRRFARNFLPSASLAGGNAPLVRAHTSHDKTILAEESSIAYS